MNKIDMRKEYRTASGTPVELLTTAGRTHRWKVLGYIEDSLNVTFWNSEGVHELDPTLKLVEVSPYDDLKVDDVLRIDSDGETILRHYAGNGKFYPYGSSSKTHKTGYLEDLEDYGNRWEKIDV